MHMIDYYVIFHVEFVRKQVYIIAIGFMYIYTQLSLLWLFPLEVYGRIFDNKYIYCKYYIWHSSRFTA